MQLNRGQLREGREGAHWLPVSVCISAVRTIHTEETFSKLLLTYIFIGFPMDNVLNASPNSAADES